MNGPPKPERIDKILSNAGYGSRSDVKELIRSGAVSCDGKRVEDPGEKRVAETSRIEISGVSISFSKYIYLMMQKPEGVISATYDPRHTTVVDLLPDNLRRRGLFPVGRLDIDTTGLTILTDDGGFAHRLLSPKRHVEKEYEAVLDKAPDGAVLDDFERGMAIGGNVKLQPARLTQTSDSPTRVRVILTEGKFHQIKRMFAKHGIHVLELRRLRIGTLSLDPTLAPGEFRELTPAELALFDS